MSCRRSKELEKSKRNTGAKRSEYQEREVTENRGKTLDAQRPSRTAFVAPSKVLSRVAGRHTLNQCFSVEATALYCFQQRKLGP